jgi:Tfp pilus assembly protein PilE/Tfp pilus assembly protein PilO
MTRPFWRSKLLPVFVVLLALNAAVLGAWTLPRSLRQRTRAAERAVAARSELARERERAEALRERAAAIRANRADLERFYTTLAGDEKRDLLPTLAAIEELARAGGLQPGSRALRRESVDKAPLERVGVTLPLEGSYGDLVGFLRGVERSKRFLMVDRVSLRADADSGGALQVESRGRASPRAGRSAVDASRSRGVTYLELIATATIVMILASAVLPMGRVAVKRQREIELRRALREIRTGIDRYRLAVEQGQIGGTEVKLGSEGCPEELDKLVKGVTRVGASEDRKLKFLASRSTR